MIIKALISISTNLEKVIMAKKRESFAVGALMSLFASCAVLQNSGIDENGILQIDYVQTPLESNELNEIRTLNKAYSLCKESGYNSAVPLAGRETKCLRLDLKNQCIEWQISVKFQCADTEEAENIDVLEILDTGIQAITQNQPRDTPNDNTNNITQRPSDP